jgi:hypothetical protein
MLRRIVATVIILILAFVLIAAAGNFMPEKIAAYASSGVTVEVRYGDGPFGGGKSADLASIAPAYAEPVLYTYKADGSKLIYQYANGPTVSSVLSAAGINLARVQTVQFFGSDNAERTVGPGELTASKYAFPNLLTCSDENLNPTFGAEEGAEGGRMMIIAITDSWSAVKGILEGPHTSSMRLSFGMNSASDGPGFGSAVRDIILIRVTLPEEDKPKPPTDPDPGDGTGGGKGDGEGDGEGDGKGGGTGTGDGTGKGGGTGTETGDGTGTGAGKGDGTGTGDGTGNGSGTENAPSGESGGTGTPPVSQQEAAAPTAAQKSTVQTSAAAQTLSAITSQMNLAKAQKVSGGEIRGMKVLQLVEFTVSGGSQGGGGGGGGANKAKEAAAAASASDDEILKRTAILAAAVLAAAALLLGLLRGGMEFGIFRKRVRGTWIRY